MAITTDPDILLVMNDGSGTAPANDGTGGNGAIDVYNAGTAQYTWSAVDAGSYDGYLDIEDEGTTDMTWVDLSGETYASTLVDESMAIRFQIQGYHTVGDSKGFLVGGSRAGAGSTNGQIAVLIEDPTTGGGSPNDFDLHVSTYTVNAAGNITSGETIFQDLTFGTDYALSVSCDRSTPSAVVDRFKLDALTEYAPSTTDQTTNTLNTSGPYLGRGDFDNYYGVLARIYYYAYWRGYSISSADLALCNSAPKTTIPLWPSDTTIITVPTGPVR